MATIGASEIPEVEGILVRVTFPNAGVDRPESIGVLVGIKQHKLVKRLVKAINDGVAFTDAKIQTSISGKTYVAGNLQVVGRRLNADLKRLGY